MKHKTLKSILFSFALGLALYATVLPDTTPWSKTSRWIMASLHV